MALNNDCKDLPANGEDYVGKFPVNIFEFCKRLKGDVRQRLKNDGYENHL